MKKSTTIIALCLTLSACAKTPIYKRLHALNPDVKACLGVPAKTDVNGLYITKGTFNTYFEATECANKALEKELRAENFKDMGLFAKFAAGKLTISSMMDSGEITEEESRIALQGLYSGLVQQEDALRAQRKQEFSNKLQALAKSLDHSQPAPVGFTQPRNANCTKMGNVVNCMGY